MPASEAVDITMVEGWRTIWEREPDIEDGGRASHLVSGSAPAEAMKQRRDVGGCDSPHLVGVYAMVVVRQHRS
jgi:hypothetical protein